ncbi:hypothetical protein AVEN_124302-2-1, partial [Araneus ventricosus]
GHREIGAQSTSQLSRDLVHRVILTESSSEESMVTVTNPPKEGNRSQIWMQNLSVIAVFAISYTLRVILLLELASVGDMKRR